MGRIDCSITANYLKEKGRMTNNCIIDCWDKCPLSCKNNDLKEPCRTFECLSFDKAIEIVQKWSDEHPQKTILEDFMEKYPNAPLLKNGEPEMCPKSLGYEKDWECLNYKNCLECWSRPLPEK